MWCGRHTGAPTQGSPHRLHYSTCVGGGAIGVYPNVQGGKKPYTVPMKREPRTEAQAQALIISGLKNRNDSVKIGVHFAKPAPKREKRKPSIFDRFFKRA